MSSADQTMYLPTADSAAAAATVHETGDRSDGRSSMAICNSSVDCRGCRQPIHDQYVLHVDPDSDWHVHCLRCVECRQQLNENCTCFLRDGQPYCKSDYTRLFSVKCSRCGMGFDRNQLVMRAPRERVYHVDCFRCIVCQTRLVSGSEFALRPTDSEIVCRSDYDTIMMCEVASVDDVMMTSSSTEGDDLLSPADDSAVILSTERIGLTLFGNNNNNVKHEIDAKNNTGGGHADSPSVNCNSSNSSSASGGKKNHQNAVAETTTTSSRHASSGTRGSRSHEGHHRSTQSSLTSSSSSKTTRIRTVLNEKQLHTLRTCYAANPRPDALMKDQLVEMTGLSSRVIRVWFQNKRCKDKKRTILIKQLQQQHQDKVHGVPMIASSPVRMQDHQAAGGPAASLMHAAAVPVQIHHQYIVPQAPSIQLCPPSVAATVGAQQQQQQHSGPIATWSTPCPSHVVMQQPTTVADLQLLSAAANPVRCSPSLSISPTSLQLSEAASDDCCSTDRNNSAAFQQLLSTFGENSVVVSNSGGSVRAAIGAPLDHRTAMVDTGCCFDDVIDDGDNAADFENSLMDDDDQTTVPTSPSVQSDGLGSRVDESGGGHVLMTSDCAPGNSLLSESCSSVQQTARGRMQQQQQHATSLSFMARRHCGRGSQQQQQQQQRMDHVMTAVSAAADVGSVQAASLHRHHHHHHLGMVTPSTSAVTGGLMGSVSHLVCTDTRC